MADLEQVASDLNSASQSLQELREKYDGALDLLDNKNTEIIAALESAKSNALQEVQTASNTATSQISQLKDTSLNAVNEAKNTATSEISSKKEEALGEFSQATSEFNSTKEEALSQIEQAKTEQGEKITALEQAKTEQESSITELKESVSTQEEKITALEQAKESITANLNKKSKLLTENLTWTVGSGGDYEDLQTAINEASKYLNYGNFTITINLKQGFILSENIILNYKDLSFVKITSSDSEVSVSSSLSGSLFSLSYATFPIFNIKLNLSQNSSLNNIFSATYSKIYFKGANSGILNSKCSIFTGWGNYIITTSAIFTGCSGESVFKVYFSNINSEGADFSNFTGSILASSVTNSQINLTASKYTNCNPSTYLLSVGYYGLIISYENEKTGLQGTATNITPNQWNCGGVILYS
ncbi:coiled-coil domain-containing protein [Campylobacter jejuni]